MKTSLCILALSLLTGCMNATVPTVSYWVVSVSKGEPLAQKPKYGVVRVSQVLVRAPYDSRQIVVRRADGSVAFDAYNQFAALPSQIFKAPTIAALATSGLCKAAVDSSSSARTDALAELCVVDLALTPAEDGALDAHVSILLRLLDAQRNISAIVYGSGVSAVRDGSYTAAFSEAFGQAIRKALADL